MVGWQGRGVGICCSSRERESTTAERVEESKLTNPPSVAEVRDVQMICLTLYWLLGLNCKPWESQVTHRPDGTVFVSWWQNGVRKWGVYEDQGEWQ